jgi:hypothetical protein
MGRIPGLGMGTRTGRAWAMPVSAHHAQPIWKTIHRLSFNPELERLALLYVKLPRGTN